jgi:chromosome segregation ATPase
MQVVAHPSRDPNPIQVVRDLEAQADDSDSQLMNGILTRYTQSLSLCNSPELEADVSVGRVLSPRAEPDASQTHGIMTAGELVGKDAEILQRQERVEQELASKDAQHFLLQRKIEALEIHKQRRDEELQVEQKALGRKQEEVAALQSQVQAERLQFEQRAKESEHVLASKTEEVMNLQQELATCAAESCRLQDELKVAEQTSSEQEQHMQKLMAEVECTREQLLQLQHSHQESPIHIHKDTTGGPVVAMPQHTEPASPEMRIALPNPDEALVGLEREEDVESSGVKTTLSHTGPVVQFSRRRVAQVRLSSTSIALEDEHAGWQESDDEAPRVSDAAIQVELQQKDMGGALQNDEQQRFQKMLDSSNQALEQRAKAFDQHEKLLQNVTRDRDATAAEVAALRASLQDVTLALNETQQRLKTVILENSASFELTAGARAQDLNLTKSYQELETELEGVKSQKDALDTKLRLHLELKAVESNERMEKRIENEKWSREINALRAQLEAADAKAAAASARAASADEISKIHLSTWRSHWDVIKAQKEDAECRACAAELAVGELNGRLLKFERDLSETQLRLREALVEKTTVEVNSMIGQSISQAAAGSHQQLETEIQTVKAHRDACEAEAVAWKARAVAAMKKYKSQEESMKSLTEVAEALERSGAEWDVVVEDMQAQRDAAEARAAASEARAYTLEQTFAANNAFLQDMYEQMESSRSLVDVTAPWSVSIPNMAVRQQTSDELASIFLTQTQDLECAWIEWRSHAEAVRAQTERKAKSESAQETCAAFLSSLEVWASKVQTLEEACKQWQHKAQTLTHERDAATTRANRSETQTLTLSASAQDMRKAHQTSVHALGERVCQLEKKCVEWQWKALSLESETKKPSEPDAARLTSDSTSESLRTSIHHLRARLDTIEVSAHESQDRCQELQLKLDTLCSCILSGQGSGTDDDAQLDWSFESALKTVMHHTALRTCPTPAPGAADERQMGDLKDGFQGIEVGSEVFHAANEELHMQLQSQNETLEHASQVIGSLKNELFDIQAEYKTVVGDILVSVEDLDHQICLLQQVNFYLFASFPHFNLA